MNNKLRWQNIRRQLFRLRNDKPYRAGRMTGARILRTRVWVESILRDNQVSRLALQSKLFGEERESTGTVLRWLKGQQTVTESTVKNFHKVAKIQHTNLDIFQFPVFQLLDSNLRKSDLSSLLRRFQQQTTLGDRWVYRHTEHFPLENDSYYSFCPTNDSEALFQVGGVHGFLSILLLLRLAEFNNDASRHWLLMQDAYRAFPAFCRNKYFKKRWKDFLNLLIGIHHNVDTTSLTIAPDLEIIQKQIHSKHHPTMRKNWPRCPSSRRLIEPERPYVVAEFPFQACTSKTSLFRTRARLTN